MAKAVHGIKKWENGNEITWCGLRRKGGITYGLHRTTGDQMKVTCKKCLKSFRGQ